MSFLVLPNYGINRIVSLLEEPEAYEVGLAQERVLSEKNAMEFIAYPIPDRGLPDSVAQFSSLTKHLYHGIAGGLNTVIHCRAGIGRTGIVAAGVLLHGGFSPSEAFSLISQQRGVSVPDTQEQVNWVTNNYAVIVNK